MMERSVQVLMSTYNGEQYLRDQVESIAGQKGVTVDILVRDDGSNDSTARLLDELVDAYGIEWLAGPNKGPALSFMDLVRNAGQYDFYSFADQDDVWFEDKLRMAVDSLAQFDERPALYHCNSYLVDSELNKLGRTTHGKSESACLRNPSAFRALCFGGASGCSIVFNRALMNELRKVDTPRFVAMHDFYIFALARAMDWEIVYDPNCHFLYRRHGGTATDVNLGTLNAIKDRLRFVRSAGKRVRIDQQAEDMLSRFGSLMPEDNLALLRVIGSYRKSTRNKLLLCLHGRFDYPRMRDAVYSWVLIMLGAL